ncbi:retrovirus-related pol polyprotein from transposon TNT 1-94 [Tanacetum coccineum]
MEKEINLEKKRKELDNIVYKVGQSAQIVHMLTKLQVFYDDTHKQALGYQNPFYLKKAQQIKPTLYDGSVISSQHAIILVIDDEETLILEELNRLSEDFGKCFVPQQELFAEQAFWLQTSHPNTDQFDISPVKIKAPREFPKLEKHCISLELSMQLNQEIFQKDKSCDNQNAVEILEYFENNDLKAQLQAKDTTIRKLKDHIKSMRENDKKEKVKQDMDEIETINIELEHSVAKLLSKNELLHKEIEHLKKIFKDQFDSIKKTRDLSKEHCDSLIAQLNSKSMENADLKGQIQEKVFVTTTLQNELRRLKGKNVLDNATTLTNAITIAQEVFKLDLEPLSTKLLNNREAYIHYLKTTKEQADILHGIVEQAKAKQPLDSALEFVFAVTPLNKNKKVRFAEPVTLQSNTKQQVGSHNTPDSNKPMLTSTRVKSSTSASRLQPSGNTKNNRILRPTSSNMKNKVEDHPRSIKSKSNKKNRVKDPICDANVKHTMLNANSELICVKCKQCMFDAIHVVCFLDFVNDVNVRSKSKSAKESQKHNIWKPTGKVFTEIGYKWKPTGKLFALAGNSCPLNRITSTKVVPLKETTPHSVETQKPEFKVYNRRPKQVKYVDVPSSSSLVSDRLSILFFGTVRLGNDQIAKIMGYGDYQMGNVTISRVYYIEGLGHNLFSVGQFCDSVLEVAFRKNTCFIRNLEEVDLLLGSRDTNLYTISLGDMLKTSPICLLSKASKTKSWLWHHRLSHLNFGTLNKLAKDGLARGIPKLKFKKYHLYSTCALGKSKKSSHQPKAEDTNQEKLYLMHMDLCILMRMESINGKKYILVIVDDYS